MPDAHLESLIMRKLLERVFNECPTILNGPRRVYPGEPLPEIHSILIHEFSNFLRMAFFIDAQFRLVIYAYTKSRFVIHDIFLLLNYSRLL
jgi:hypothetical protein